MSKNIDWLWSTVISFEPGNGYRAVIGEQTSIQSLLGIGSRISEYPAVCSVVGFKSNRSTRVVFAKAVHGSGHLRIVTREIASSEYYGFVFSLFEM